METEGFLFVGKHLILFSATQPEMQEENSNVDVNFGLFGPPEKTRGAKFE